MREDTGHDMSGKQYEIGRLTEEWYSEFSVRDKATRQLSWNNQTSNK